MFHKTGLKDKKQRTRDTEGCPRHLPQLGSCLVVMAWPVYNTLQWLCKHESATQKEGQRAHSKKEMREKVCNLKTGFTEESPEERIISLSARLPSPLLHFLSDRDTESLSSMGFFMIALACYECIWRVIKCVHVPWWLYIQMSTVTKQTLKTNAQVWAQTWSKSCWKMVHSV